MMIGDVDGSWSITHKTSVIMSSSATAISILAGSTELGSCSERSGGRGWSLGSRYVLAPPPNKKDMLFRY